MIVDPAIGFGILASLVFVFISAFFLAGVLLSAIQGKTNRINKNQLTDEKIEKVAVAFGVIAVVAFILLLIRTPRESIRQVLIFFTVLGVVVCIVLWLIPAGLQLNQSENRKNSIRIEKAKAPPLKKRIESQLKNIRNYFKNIWNAIFPLNYEHTIWVEEDDLGKEKLINHKNKNYYVKIPAKINGKVALRLGGLGKKRKNTTGDLLLHVWLNKGIDIRKCLWLSESSVINGTEKILSLDEKKIRLVVPPKSHDGLVIRIKGLGGVSEFNKNAPFVHRKRGNLLVKLFVYPDSITPQYGSFDSLNIDEMALEGWVYRKIDEVVDKISKSALPIKPLQADAIADLFNELGWRGILHALIDHLKLNKLNIGIAKSTFISLPGSCQRAATTRDGVPQTYNYFITINERFLDNPFSIAAILAHELCHAVYAERIEDKSRSTGYGTKSEQATLEEEHTVDLLVFMYKLGEFQLRVARDERLTLGYFDQRIFERIQVIVSKKLNAHESML
jgi:hypothetical protein